MASGWADYEDSGRVTLLEMEGHQGFAPSDEDVAAWRGAAEPLHARCAEAVGGAGHDPDEVMSGLISELEGARFRLLTVPVGSAGVDSLMSRSTPAAIPC